MAEHWESRIWDWTEDEVKEYAEFLGMDVDRDSELLWIAREALTAPLPADWIPCVSTEHDNEVFYFNVNTGESQWDHPCDEYYKSLYIAEAPKRIVMLEATPQSDGKIQVSCTNMGGDEIGTLSLKPQRTLEKLAQELGQLMELSQTGRKTLSFVLADGRLLTESDRLLPVREIFGLSCDKDLLMGLYLTLPCDKEDGESETEED